jgi:hypothetical protein
VDYTAKILSETDVRVIGVCFGHQIVGRALKAKVGRNPDGWEAAVNDVQLSEKGKELFGVDKLVCCATEFLCQLGWPRRLLTVHSGYIKCIAIVSSITPKASKN